MSRHSNTSGNGAQSARPMGSITGLSPFVPFTLASRLTAPGALPIDEAVDLATQSLLHDADSGLVERDTITNYVNIIARFARFAQQGRVRELRQVTPMICHEFIHARLGQGQGGTLRRRGEPASIGTWNLRRSALRALFTKAALLGLQEVDPTRRMRLEGAKKTRPPRPLTPHEVVLCRTHAQRRPSETLWPAIVALSCAAMSLTETAYLSIGDVDLSAGVVEAPGTVGRYAPRRLLLQDWQVDVLERRVTALANEGHRSPNHPIAFSRAGQALSTTITTATQSQALLRVLAKAGLLSPMVRDTRPIPTACSFREYGVNRAYALATNDRLEAARDVAGVKRTWTVERWLDSDWQHAYGQSLRDAGVNR